MSENSSKNVWETPTLHVLGDLATLTAAGGVPIPDVMDLSTTGSA